MTTFKFKGKTYPCLEHIKEIKATPQGDLFKKYYNKKQMFKDLLGKVKRIDDNGTHEFYIDPVKGYVFPYDSYGKISGQVIYTKDYDYDIEFYRPKYIVEDIERTMAWGDSFFVKDDDGQVWFVYIDVD